MSEEIAKIKLLLSRAPWQTEKIAREIEALLPTLEAKLTISEKSGLQRRVVKFERIDEETGEYVLSQTYEKGGFKFYLRFLSKDFIPCEKCQKELQELIANADFLILGNKSYEPALELSKRWEIDDDSWKEIERRQPTKEEEKRLKKL